MKTKYLAIFILVLFSVNFIAASEPFQGFGKQYECRDIVQTCASCSYNNISMIKSPNGTSIAMEQSMTKSGITYTWNTCAYSKQLGRYEVSGHGDLDGTDTTWGFHYIITSSGGESTSVWDNAYLIFFVVLGGLLLGLGMIYGIPWLGFISSVMFILGGVYTMIYGLNTVADMYSQGIAIVLIGLGFIFMMLSAYEWAMSE